MSHIHQLRHIYIYIYLTFDEILDDQVDYAN